MGNAKAEHMSELKYNYGFGPKPVTNWRSERLYLLLNIVFLVRRWLEMTGVRLRIDCAEFRRKLSRGNASSCFLDFLKSRSITECLQNGSWRPQLPPGGHLDS